MGIGAIANLVPGLSELSKLMHPTQGQQSGDGNDQANPLDAIKAILSGASASAS